MSSVRAAEKRVAEVTQRADEIREMLDAQEVEMHRLAAEKIAALEALIRGDEGASSERAEALEAQLDETAAAIHGSVELEFLADRMVAEAKEALEAARVAATCNRIRTLSKRRAPLAAEVTKHLGKLADSLAALRAIRDQQDDELRTLGLTVRAVDRFDRHAIPWAIANALDGYAAFNLPARLQRNTDLEANEKDRADSIESALEQVIGQ